MNSPSPIDTQRDNELANARARRDSRIEAILNEADQCAADYRYARRVHMGAALLGLLGFLLAASATNCAISRAPTAASGGHRTLSGYPRGCWQWVGYAPASDTTASESASNTSAELDVETNIAPFGISLPRRVAGSAVALGAVLLLVVAASQLRIAERRMRNIWLLLRGLEGVPIWPVAQRVLSRTTPSWVLWVRPTLRRFARAGFTEPEKDRIGTLVRFLLHSAPLAASLPLFPSWDLAGSPVQYLYFSTVMALAFTAAMFFRAQVASHRTSVEPLLFRLSAHARLDQAAYRARLKHDELRTTIDQTVTTVAKLQAALAAATDAQSRTVYEATVRTNQATLDAARELLPKVDSLLELLSERRNGMLAGRSPVDARRPKWVRVLGDTGSPSPSPPTLDVLPFVVTRGLVADVIKLADSIPGAPGSGGDNARKKRILGLAGQLAPMLDDELPDDLPALVTDPALGDCLRKLLDELGSEQGFGFWKGARLPTKDEWGRVARVDVAGSVLPWRNAWWSESEEFVEEELGLGYSEDVGPLPVGSFPDAATCDGVFDLVGGVPEVGQEANGAFFSFGGSWNCDRGVLRDWSAPIARPSSAGRLGIRLVRDGRVVTSVAPGPGPGLETQTQAAPANPSAPTTSAVAVGAGVRTGEAAAGSVERTDPEGSQRGKPGS